VRPERSVIVPDTISGIADPVSAAWRRGECDLGVERVEDRLDQQYVDALHETRDLLAIGLGEVRNVIRGTGDPPPSATATVTLVGPIAPPPNINPSRPASSAATGEPAGDRCLVDQLGIGEAVVALATTVDENVLVVMSAPATGNGGAGRRRRRGT
jgi:hypothetical protein